MSKKFYYIQNRKIGGVIPPPPPPPPPGPPDAETANYIAPIYGLLYNSYVTSDVRGIAPDGWRVPTVADLDVLNTAYSADPKPITYPGDIAWSVEYGNNVSQLSLLGTGYRDYDIGFNLFNSYTTILSPFSVDSLWALELYPSFASLQLNALYITPGLETNALKNGYPIRLIKEDGIPPVGDVVEVDGILYNTIVLGGQVWTERNLIARHYKNGDPVQYASSNADWTNAGDAGIGAYCAYNNDSTTAGEIDPDYLLTDARLVRIDSVALYPIIDNTPGSETITVFAGTVSDDLKAAVTGSLPRPYFTAFQRIKIPNDGNPFQNGEIFSSRVRNPDTSIRALIDYTIIVDGP